MYDNDTEDALKQAIESLVYPTGYTDFRLSNVETDLVVLNPKTSTSGNLDFISLTSSFLDNFRGDGQYKNDYTFTDMTGEGISTIGVSTDVPRFGALMGYEVSVAMAGSYSPVGTLSVIQDLVDLGTADTVGFSINPKYPSLHIGFRHLLNSFNSETQVKTTEMLKGSVSVPKGLTLDDFEETSKVMGFYYTSAKSILGLYTEQFIDQSSVILTTITNTVTPHSRLAETLFIVEILPGCCINIAVATYNSELGGYLIDIVTAPNQLQVPKNARVPSEEITIGYMSARSYKADLLKELEDFIAQLTPESDTESSTPVEIDGVIHFPKTNMS